MPIDLVPQLVSATIRASAFGLVAFVALQLFRVRSSAARHAAWTVVLAGMLLQLPLGSLAPRVPLRALPAVPGRMRPPVAGSSRVAGSRSQPLASGIPTRTVTIPKQVSWAEVLSGLYLAISILLLVRMIFGAWRLGRMLRDLTPISELGAGIFESSLFTVPAAVGCFRPRIVLPRVWRNWDAVRLRAVLLHERAHIRRKDCPIRVASRVNSCIFWFHPLEWWMERELARRAEEACDDIALSEMKDKEEYAAALVEIAHAAVAEGGALGWQVISMAKESNVIRRVNRILNPRLKVPKLLSGFACATLFVCSAPVIYLSAAVQLAPANRESIVSKHAALPVLPAEAIRQPLLTGQKSPMGLMAHGLMAQAATHQDFRLAAPPSRSRPESSPITICVLIDSSGSMEHKRAEVEAAALALVKASRPGDKVSIMDFSDQAFNELPHNEAFTSDVHEMEEALARIDPRGGSAIRDALRTTINHVEQTAQNGTKVAVLITDGNDTSSTVTEDELLAEIRNSGVRVYCIGLLNEDNPGEARTAKLALNKLAATSGGLDYYPENLREAEHLGPEIANRIREQ